MKFKLIHFVLLAFMITSCSSSDDSESNPDDMNTDDAVLVMGDFISSAHPTFGTASVNLDKTELTLTNFKSDDGPLLELYLTTNLDANTFISLGELKGLDGNYTYALPENVDYENYKYVIVWCVDFSVNFGYAILE